MTRIAVCSHPVRRHTVRMNRVGLALSVVSLLNIASMPMKAYISEYLPWRAPPTVPDTYANYSDFNAQKLAFNGALYNNETLSRGATYLTDTVHDIQVMRYVLFPALVAPISRDNCLSQFLVGLPGLVFFTPAQMDYLCHLVEATNATTPVGVESGSCFRNTQLTLEIGTICLWVTRGDAVYGSNDSLALTYSFVYNAPRYCTWLWCKFAYRVFTTGIVIRRLWSQYYRHIVHLRQRLVLESHVATPRRDRWRYELVLGDPTAIILLDAWVALAFVVDIWLSTANVGIAVLRASQNSDIVVNLLNILYLSRTVWFGYFGLCMTAHLLRRYEAQHLFDEVDPTMVAIGVTVFGPLISWLSGNWAPLASVYHWLFSVLVPYEQKSEKDEIFLACVFYTFCIASLPVGYGFVAASVRHRAFPMLKYCKIGVGPRLRAIDYSSYVYNTVKNRLLLSLVRSFRDPSAMPSRGGSIYELFRRNANYKTSATLSLCGADCYLLCYDGDDVLTEKLRLSLLSSLSQNGRTTLIAESRTASPYIFNALEMQLPDVLRSRSSKVRVQGEVAFVAIQRPLAPSPWCL
ncbi:hypothetical protein SDRG_11386 [Saprolegnia diclina VS20]|uniref:Uncharacterized protein n=1 Tax=Saprolegnia diclina (strain VS20) TaxID=1156394 RepID=T0Q8F9_SAPDV|nr:hypothetical protein SDRG_11386 [Saprolegnia diclina VS20]EQC30906.1 hypothetical protein SDRG_11386 [Saprolegnia diclina VS20]|eukprot:XP_008615644.1 hypothetical protein SDRG_11386 [Saprolegnia diclina VS20]